jgi:aryl-alcohol dehydrogenase-like predicted oxidoreductase
MQTVDWNEWRLSRLMLGTVQFGLPYGVANRVGQPDYATVREMVELALAGGVNCFDTAAAYGASEEVLGRALRELNALDRVLIVTKVQPLPDDQAADAGQAAEFIQQSIERSRQRLGLDQLPVVLFHREQDAVHWEALWALKERGLIGRLGVSCDNVPGPANGFAARSGVEALQLPANLVDRRHWRSGVFQIAQARGVAIFLRSVYLQGLLLMPDGEIPASLQEIIEPRRQLQTLAAASGMTLAELAVRYLLSLTGATCVLVGVETSEQLRTNLEWFRRGPLDADMLSTVESLDWRLAEVTITPRLWKTR